MRYPQTWRGGTKSIYPSRLEFSSEFAIGYPGQYTPYEGWKAQQPKFCDNNKDSSPQINSENIVNFLSQKLRQKFVG